MENFKSVESMSLEERENYIYEFLYKDYSKEELIALIKNLDREKLELQKLISFYQIELKYSK